MKTKTYLQLAKRIEISQAYLSYLIHGDRRPSWRVAKRLARILGRDPAWVMDAAGDELRDVIDRHLGKTRKKHAAPASCGR